MHIGFISQWYDPEGGSAAIPAGLVRGLLKAGHTVEVVTGYPNYPFGRIYDGYRQQWRRAEAMDGAQVQRVPIFPSHSSHILHRLISYASFALSSWLLGLRRLDKCDAYIAYATPITAAIGPLLRRSGPPVLTIVPDLWPDTLLASQFNPRSTTGAILRFLARKMSDFVYQRSSMVVCTSEEMRKILLQRGLAAERTKTVYNWIDETVFDDKGLNHEYTDRERRPSSFIVLYAGNLGPLQDVDNLLHAAQKLQDHPNIKIVIVGSGTDETRLREKSASLHLTNVEFESQVRPQDIAFYLSQADVHIVSLIDREPFQATIPSKLQYSMASGKPIISTVRGETSQHVLNSRCGLAAEPSDADALAAAILELSQMTSEQRALMGSAATQYYQSFFSERVGIRKIDEALSGMMTS